MNNKIETNRLRIYPASEEQIKKFIEAQTIAELKVAYTEMLNGVCHIKMSGSGMLFG